MAAGGLAQGYSAMAEDGGLGAPKREAATLLSLAEGHLDKLEAAKALSLSLEALDGFRNLGDAAGIADATRLLAATHIHQAEYDDAEVIVTEQMESFQTLGDKAGEAKMMLSLAETNVGRKNQDSLETALDHANKALGLFKAAGDKRMEATTLVALSNIHLQVNGDTRKRADDAKQACAQAAAIFQELGDVKGEGAALHGMACSRALLDVVDGALRSSKEALALYQKANLRKLEASELQYIAACHLKEEDYEEAIQAADDALEIYWDCPQTFTAESDCMQTLVEAYLANNENKRALRVARVQLERFADAGNKRGVAAAYEAMVRVYSEAGNAEKAVAAAESSADASDEMGDMLGKGRLLRQAAQLYVEVGNHEKALRSAQEALTIFEEVDDVKEQAITLQCRADIYSKREEHDRALRSANEAAELFQDAGELEGEANAMLQLCRAQVASGDDAMAVDTAREAQDKYSEVGSPLGEAQALRVLIQLRMRTGDYEVALRELARGLQLEKECGDREGEVTAMSLMAQAQVYLLVEKKAEGKVNEKAMKDGMDKALRMAKDALSSARRTGDAYCTAVALHSLAQVHMLSTRFADALKAVEEAVTLFRETGEERAEASTLVLYAQVLLYGNKDFRRARETAEEAIYLFQQIGDAAGEDSAWTELERIDRIEGEQKAAAAAARQMQQQQMAPQGGLTLTPLAPQMDAQEAVSAAGYEAKMVKMDLSGGLNAETVKQQIAEVAKGLIGFDEEIEYDMPLMESGLTSNTAVLLRDSLSQQLPGISLPVTLVFDYPSIESMSELILENAEKAAKKAAKAMKG